MDRQSIPRKAFSRLFPEASVELKHGIERRTYPLFSSKDKEDEIRFSNEIIELSGSREAAEVGSGYCFTLRLENKSRKSIRITRLRFPAEHGLDEFLKGLVPNELSFLRNGYQSWSTARSYKIGDRPLRPRIRLVSLATSNMANLPSNVPGSLSSEMYAVLTNLRTGKAFLVGQCSPFDQFFYIRLDLARKGKNQNRFELVYDFGRQMILPGCTISLDGIIFISGETKDVLESYFDKIRADSGYRPPDRNIRGWCSWYQYSNRINPKTLLSNLKILKERRDNIDFFLIDDGWESAVGDWLEGSPAFRGRMKEMADHIRNAGFRPGIWLSPFAAGGRSEIARLHPEYLIRDQYGKKIKAGYNPIWKGLYYGLDVTDPRFQESLRDTIRTIVHDWGYEYLKCDFLFAGCLRGGAYHDYALSRAGILKLGMDIIREEAGKEAVIIGCGMPLSAGIGKVDAMRIGPDTGDFWIRYSGKLFRTGAMVGVRNSIRNTMVRSQMHKTLWLNDPDCAMYRETRTKLSAAERSAQLAVIALSGGILVYSDELSSLSPAALAEKQIIDRVNEECFHGRTFPLDIMEREIPEILYNSSGYLGLFNFGPARSRSFDLSMLIHHEAGLRSLVDLGTGRRIVLEGKGIVDIGFMPKRGCGIFKIEREERFSR